MHLPEVHTLPVSHCVFAVHAAHCFVIAGDDAALMLLQYLLVQSAAEAQVNPFAFSAITDLLAVRAELGKLIATAFPVGMVISDFIVVADFMPVTVGVFVCATTVFVAGAAVTVGVFVGVLNEGVAASIFATHLHEVQVPLVQSAFTVHSCLLLAIMLVLSLLVAAVLMPGSAFLYIIFAKSPKKLAVAIELTIKSATKIANNCFVFIVSTSPFLL